MSADDVWTAVALLYGCPMEAAGYGTQHKSLSAFRDAYTTAAGAGYISLYEALRHYIQYREWYVENML